MTLEVKAAAELIALDMEGRQVARRTARETELMRHVFQTFVDRSGPILVQDIATGLAA